MSWSLHMDKSAADGIVNDPQGPVMSALRDVLALHAVRLVPETTPGAKKGGSFVLSTTDGHEFAPGEESAIVDELMLADTTGFINGATAPPQPSP